MFKLSSGRYSWEFAVGVCRPVLQILTLFQTKKLSFSTTVFSPALYNPFPFSDLAYAGRLSLLRLERKQNRFLKSHLEFAYYPFFLIHLELKRKNVHAFPRKPYPNSD